MPSGGAAATGSFAAAPASAKRSPRWTTLPVTVASGLSVTVARAAPAERASETAKRAAKNLVIAALLDLAEGRHHLVGGLDDLRVHLIGALRRDEIGDLRDDVDRSEEHTSELQ